MNPYEIAKNGLYFCNETLGKPRGCLQLTRVAPGPLSMAPSGQDFLRLLSGPMNKFYLLGCRSAFFQLVGKPMNVLIWLMYRIQAYGKAKAL